MTRFAAQRRVFFFEEPVFDGEQSGLEIRRDHLVHVVVPHLQNGLSSAAVNNELHRLVKELMSQWKIDHPVAWYYTPMALNFARDIPAAAIVFDCMDELSAFHGAPRELLELEAELIGRADLLFTGGQSLYEAKKHRHPRAFAFPSSVDVPHFSKARCPQPDPDDQAPIAHPRLGFFGVIDERMDLALVDAVADLHPEWQFVFLGPVVKIDPKLLPRRPNVHYLGLKAYGELPGYLAGWDVALLPFARNEATRFISPTKTPEYLAAGRRVVSTSVQDVVRPYGVQGLVDIADTPEAFAAAVQRALGNPPAGWRRQVDDFLSEMSWDRTWSAMCRLIDDVAAPSTTVVDTRLHTPTAARPGVAPARL
jgi:UDP-galactopyranose mutase